MDSHLFITKTTKDYELIDSGEGMKLERFGGYVLSRPDPEALWKRGLDLKIWNTADAIFARRGTVGVWTKKKDFPKSWVIEHGGLQFEVKPTSFKHVGIFPEQAQNWKFIETQIKKSKKELTVLNLFGYTGGASLAAAKAGAKVTHVDGSKVALTWAHLNQELSGLQDKPIRWILDDAISFLRREVKRGNTYDAIVMDPPAFGRGPKGEPWKIEEQFGELFELCMKVLSSAPCFFIINGYASGYSPTAYKNNLLHVQEKFGGTIETGELGIEESKTKRILPAGIVARWYR